MHPIKKTPRYFWLCFYKRLGQCGRNNDRGNKRYLFYYRLGELYFKEAPKQITFGTEKIRNQPLIKLGHPTEGLKVVDERNANNWRLQLKQTQPLTNDSIVMPDVFLSFQLLEALRLQMRQLRFRK